MQIGLSLSTPGTHRAAGGAPVQPPGGIGPAIEDAQQWIVDDDAVDLGATASGEGLTFSYGATGLPEGLAIGVSTGRITGTPAAAASGTATVTATDQYARVLQDSFTWSSALRMQATGGTELDLSFPEGRAISSADLVQNWTANGNTLTFVSVSPSLPTGLSIDSDGAMTGTPATATADDTYTLTMEDEYGRETTGTFTLEVTAVDTTAPTASSISAGTQAGNGDVPVAVTGLDEDGTLHWVLVGTGDSAPSASDVVAGKASGGGSPSDSGSQAVTTTGGPYNLALTSGLDGSFDLHVVFRDAAGNTSPIHSDTAISIDTTAPSISTLFPADGATDVAVDANLVMTFSEGMKRQGTVTLKNVGGATIETFDLSTDGTWSTTSETDDTWTGNPASDFSNSASLAVRWSGLEDTTGNALPDNATDTTWTFDVAAAASGPSVVQRAAVYHEQGTYSSSNTVTLPSGITDGNTLLLVVYLGVNRTLTVPSGWAQIGSIDAGPGDSRVVFLEKVASSDSGASVPINLSGNSTLAAIFHELDLPTGDVEIATLADAGDPPSHTPSGGSAEYLWIAGIAKERAPSDAALSAPPSGYGNGLMAKTDANSTSSGHGTIFTTEKIATASSEDPGTFTIGGALPLDEGAWTISAR